MTPEKLIKAIDILAGQGNQVDCGGQLRDVLKGILGLDYEFNGISGEMQLTEDEYNAMISSPIMPMETREGGIVFGVQQMLDYDVATTILENAFTEIGLPDTTKVDTFSIWTCLGTLDNGNVNSGFVKVVFETTGDAPKKYFCVLEY